MFNEILSPVKSSARMRLKLISEKKMSYDFWILTDQHLLDRNVRQLNIVVKKVHRDAAIILPTISSYAT